MANQMIALQARVPNVDPLGGAIRNNAQMINMMAQQQAAQRQNAIAEQTMQIQRAREGRETALAGPQLAEAQSKAGTAKLDFNLKALGYAYHSALANPSDETLDQSKAILLNLGADETMVDSKISDLKQLPLEQRKGVLLQTILRDPNSKAAFEATLPKLVHIKLNDRDIARDNNPLSPSFGQTFSTDIMGVSPNTVFNKTMRGAAPVRVSGGGGGGGVPSGRGGGGGGVPSGRGGAAPAADGGGRPTQSQRPSKGAQPTAGAPSADARAIAVQNLYDVIEEAHKKGHLVSEDQSYAANRAQELLTGRTYLPGGTAKKTSIDSIDAAANQLLRMYIQKGTSGTLNTKPEQEAFLRGVGGGNTTYDARMKTIRNFAKQNGIKLDDYAAKPRGQAKPPAAGAAPKKTEAVDMNNPLLKGL